MLSARLIVTLIGSPSGTATTISVTAIISELSATRKISMNEYAPASFVRKNMLILPTTISAAMM